MKEKGIKLAIIDMNNGVPNKGLNCIIEIVKTFEDVLEWKVFDARQKNEIPDLSFDIYISSGGPGSPLEEGSWRSPFLELVDQVFFHNKRSEEKKHFFFICYSFQVVCAHFMLGEITKRKSTSFGVFPVHKTPAGLNDALLNALDNPYYAVDSRDWQLVQPRLKVIEKWGAKILSLEKIRTHVEYERAIMAVRFSDEFVGTQFHPEAEPEEMKEHFSIEENRDKVINNFSVRKYNQMMRDLNDDEKVAKTHNHLLPGFIRNALNQIAIQTV